MLRTAASPELEHLSSFVGIWETEGEVRADPSGPLLKFKAGDSYEWLPGGYFLFHRFDAQMPEGKVVGIEIIGYDKDKDAYTMYSFDSQGNSDVMVGHFEMDNWTFIGKYTLFSGGFREGGRVFAGLWERRADSRSDWQPWMEVRLKKIV